MTNEELLVAMTRVMSDMLDEKLDKKLEEKLDQSRRASRRTGISKPSASPKHGNCLSGTCR